ncbi:AAA family ATPase [Clostridium sp. DJ247]|uniref:AAA family ATPase n=1 Tax=Clostridium sp. DJ247 TaxID=2726188 RepID=UPI001628F6F2|nr:AAA family ATPase [Clostridium sp. DJ247]MBC2582778.1 AAA family ATPase [Clostridium sp. DJ247]
MERFLIKKLIVISDKEKASFEAEFDKGLNIIIGENKMGKSSIIKSIFYTLGCETDMEGSWKELIDNYILFFYYGLESYCLIRREKKYKIFKTDDVTSKFVLLCNAENYNDYTDYLLKEIFNIDVELIDKNGKTVSFIPPLLFKFQYIDQDKGWSGLADSFTNSKYVKAPKNFAIKYIIGYQGEEYYKAKKDIEIVKMEIGSLRVKQNHFNELVDSMTESLNSKGIDIEGKSLEKLKEEVDNIINQLSCVEREKILINESISEIKNNIYEKTLELNFLKKSIEHLEKDHSFALEQGEEIKCPVCGMIYNNSISERVEIVKDIQSGDELISSYRSDINGMQDSLDIEVKKKLELMKKVNGLKVQLTKLKKDINIAELYKNEGRREIFNVSVNEKQKLEDNISAKEIEKSGYESEVKKLDSRKRMNDIKKDFKDIFEKVLEKVKVSSSSIKLTGFIQKIENTGSERPRIILSYHLALYLYNLQRGENPFNWLVIDTPNQQGQDAKNLKNIDSLISLMLTDKGQVIMGTERETGYEDKASKVIRLTKYKRCLSSDTYDKHRELLSKLEDLALFN